MNVDGRCGRTRFRLDEFGLQPHGLQLRDIARRAHEDCNFTLLEQRHLVVRAGHHALDLLRVFLEQLEDGIHVGWTRAVNLGDFGVGHHARVGGEAGPRYKPFVSRVFKEIAVALRRRDEIGIIGNAVDLDRDGWAIFALEGRIEHSPIFELRRVDLLDEVVLDGDGHLTG